MLEIFAGFAMAQSLKTGKEGVIQQINSQTSAVGTQGA